MIPLDYITEWRQSAPWVDNAQVEQDLIISRTLVELYRRDDVSRFLAFRGGTAIYKLFLDPAPRYSEDIDLVQIEAGPIKPCLQAVQGALDPWLGTPFPEPSSRRTSPSSSRTRDSWETLRRCWHRV